ncbi:MAG: hypothetical protein R3F50_08880 [Gammaproteobacteria bacterium]|jgi:hypothetical protein
MRSLLTVCLLILSFNATAQSDYTIVWNMVGWDAESSPDRISLDLNQGNYFIAANGIVEYFNGSTFATSGTCFLTDANSIFCNLVVGFFSMELEISLDDGLEGDVLLIDFDGFLLDVGSLDFIRVE